MNLGSKSKQIALSKAQPTDMEAIWVRDLLIPGSREWDAELIEELFTPRDAREILSIALSPQAETDRRIWMLGKTGEYIVRSAYRLIYWISC
ncbi:hypothetical protein LINPERPRIM_LOCUS6681 [Linum perenne]